jgi:hypothetical protein
MPYLGHHEGISQAEKKTSFVLLMVQAQERKLETVVCCAREKSSEGQNTGEKVFKLGTPAAGGGG